jgi:ubiquitin-protein ligase
MSRRILKELRNKDWESCNLIKLSPQENPMIWDASIISPIDSPYKGKKFNLEIVVGYNYPFKPPSVRFISPIVHSSVSSDGEICIDILNKEWSPAYTLTSVVLSILSILSDLPKYRKRID